VLLEEEGIADFFGQRNLVLSVIVANYSIFSS
jgi:hypothetical protein